jgi:hypothetical protein
VAALVFERDPTLSPTQVWELLRSTARLVATPPGGSSSVVGIIDACAAIGKLVNVQACP